MHKVLMVIRREYLERVRKKSFWIGMALFPILMVAMIGGQILLAQVGSNKQQRLAVADGTGKLFDAIRANLAKYTIKDGRPEYVLTSIPAESGMEAIAASAERQILAGETDAVVAVGADVDSKDNFRYFARNVGAVVTMERIESALRKAVIGLRLEKQNLAIDKGALDALLAPVQLEPFEVSEKGTQKKSFLTAYFGTFAFVMILYMSLLLYGIAVMRGILEEKSNRVIEVLLGSLSPTELMAGKILGIGLVGLTQITVYALTAGLVRAYVFVRQVEGDWTGILSSFTAGKMAMFFVFFLLGYFLFTSLFAAIGAVCNSEQEAQNLQTPVVMCLVVPMILTFFFLNDPNRPAAVVLSLIPIFTPMLMYMRISLLQPPVWQVVLSIVLTLLTILILFRGVGKIFRIGILMYGKKPTIPEIIRWARS